MKLTTKQLRQIIKEELNEVYIDKQGLPGSFAAKLDKYGTAALLGSMGVLAATAVGAPAAAIGAGAGLTVRKALNWLYDKHQLKSLEEDMSEQSLVTMTSDIIEQIIATFEEEGVDISDDEIVEAVQEDLNDRLRSWQTARMRNDELPEDIIHMLRFEEHLIDAADGSTPSKQIVKQALDNLNMLGNETKLKKVGREISKATSPTEWVKMIKDAMTKKASSGEEDEFLPLPVEDMPTVADWDPDDAPTGADWDPEDAPTMVAESTFDRIIMEEIGRAVRLG